MVRSILFFCFCLFGFVVCGSFVCVYGGLVCWFVVPLVFDLLGGGLLVFVVVCAPCVVV